LGTRPNKLLKIFYRLRYLAGQLLGFYKSLELSLKPDEPSVNGAISRVVQGVNIYPVETQLMMNGEQ
jgi:tagatose-6-phosphate ketose/aldose isomerase